MRNFKFSHARACHKAGEMNRYESDYSALLETRKQAGEITAYYFERYKLKLGNNCYYTPDFMVVRADGVLEFHEVKGYWEEDARVKIKAAADQYPHIFVAVTRPSRKADRERTPWIYEYFTKEDKKAPAPQPAGQHICRDCKYFDWYETFPCMNHRKIVGPYNDACDQFTPKKQ